DLRLKAEEESLHGHNVNCIDRVIATHITSHQLASNERSSDDEEVPLGSNHINRVNSRGSRRQCALRRYDGIVPAGSKRRQSVATEDIVQGCPSSITS